MAGRNFRYGGHILIEILENAFTWVMENSDNIRLVFSIATFLFMIITAIVTIKHKNVVTKMQEQTAELNKIVTDYKQIITEFDNLRTNLEEYKNNTNLSIDKMIDVQNVDTDLIKKLNAVVDILGLAFSTSKNDAIRVGITNLVNEARQIDPNNAKLVNREIQRLVTNKVVEEINNNLPKQEITEPVNENVTDDNVDNVVRRY